MTDLERCDYEIEQARSQEGFGPTLGEIDWMAERLLIEQDNAADDQPTL